MRVLVVDDNPGLAKLIQQSLCEQSYSVNLAYDARTARDLGGDDYDVIILDRMLPDGDGVDVCRQLRNGGVNAPILMLTALSATAEKVAGLNAGADDYLTKPFQVEELVARVRALLRRGEACEAAALKFGDLRMDLARREVRRAETPVRLTAREFALLEYLIRNPDRVLSRLAIAENVWDSDTEGGSNVVEVYISRLRNKIDKGFTPALIHTVVGVGYMLSMKEPQG